MNFSSFTNNRHRFHAFFPLTFFPDLSRVPEGCVTNLRFRYRGTQGVAELFHTKIGLSNLPSFDFTTANTLVPGDIDTLQPNFRCCLLPNAPGHASALYCDSLEALNEERSSRDRLLSGELPRHVTLLVQRRHRAVSESQGRYPSVSSRPEDSPFSA